MLKIVESPDPLLSEVCDPCTPGDKALVRLSKQMAHAMYKNNGCGIAAPQVGVGKRLVVIDVDYDGEGGEKNTIVLVNPEIVELKGEPEMAGEGCLSCPASPCPSRVSRGHACATTILRAISGRSKATGCWAAVFSTRSIT